VLKRGLKMKNNHRVLLVMLFLVLAIVISACGSSSDNPQANLNAEDIDENQTENSPADADHTELNDEENTSNHASTDSNDGKSFESVDNDNEITDNKKEEYLKELNDMEELDRNLDVATTTEGMEEQEAERYKTWDEELNEIYGALETMLDEEQMEKLREEQRSWIKDRDELAKQSSLKYEGGSTESLEYVATQASLTRERCYELVAKYM
jgi:uncharacterized protein YecT (DUF1311 family)